MPKPPIQIERRRKPETDCSHCDAKDCLTERYQEREMVIREETLLVSIPRTVCRECNAAWGNFDQSDRAVEIAVSTYQKKRGLLTGKAALANRKKLGLTQESMAEHVGIDVATIQRLETGVHVISREANDMIDQFSERRQ